MPPKSIFRQPGAKHFQLVHRSQRDPLIHDPAASKHVLKEFERGNTKRGKSRADLEQVLHPADLANDGERANIGEAAAYGVYFDDTNYDYMQHLRSVGIQEDGVESVLIEAPSTRPKAKGKAIEPITLVDLPPETLPSTSEVPRNYESQQAIPSSLSGFQPDMDPHLRQVLEALEDDAFVEESLEDGFFAGLVADGERDEEADFDYEFREEGVEDELEEDEDDEDGGWEARFARFKREQKPFVATADHNSDLDEYSDGGDTLGTLPQFSVIGGKKRRKGASDASGYSMSSSSMFRNEGLTTLDERFDQVQKEYESDEDSEDRGSDSDEEPELITSREDFNDMMNEFLENYEIIGGKMQPVLAGETSVDKLNTIRKALGEAKIRDDDNSDREEDILMPIDIDEEKDRWDCETILTTYSNLENHPRLIRARQAKSIPKIQVDPKTGLPIVDGQRYSAKGKQIVTIEEEDEEEEDDRPVHVTVSRDKNESKEDKKMRKQAIKAEKQTRRADKKANKERFASEIKQQAKNLSDKEKSKMRKL